MTAPTTGLPVTLEPGVGIPAAMGRRVLARVVDAAISVVLVVAFQLLSFAALLGGGGTEGLLVIAGLLVVWTLFSLWSILARAALPGQLVLGLQHVDADTDRPAGGRTLLKYVVEGCTLGLAVLITPLSIQAPNRSWFDRVAGVTLLDRRATGAGASDGARVSAPPTGWRADESQLTQMDVPTALPASPGAPAGPAAGGMISSVPFGSGSAALASGAPPAVERPVGVPVSRPAAEPLQPALAQPVPPAPVPSSPQPVVVLDDGQRIAVTGTLVLGRDPRPSATLGHAALVVVADQSVSANHLAIGLDAAGPWVMDLRSTNGSWVEQGGDGARRLEPMAKVAVSPGAVVRTGKRRMTVVAG